VLTFILKVIRFLFCAVEQKHHLVLIRAHRNEAATHQKSVLTVSEEIANGLDLKQKTRRIKMSFYLCGLIEIQEKHPTQTKK
jgi:hypothetical protein